ncbi:hypothetical protein ACMSI6_13385 [Pseudomonas antarctica]|uniref:Uncharacterized protein n=1 Tax=Pseudomonas antarctica TaxID=219572 RepID=A0A1G9WK74_9PSED|nr:hypothetical protein [Pseudomonas antarctica]KAF2409457.1 hypothetical protein PSAN_18620 [Pseudomonas antarctica]SDM84747.1 hypothetical protein SAMN04490179_1224 [Pseudomonas antarctica]
MENQCYAMNARQDGSLSDTFVSWDEFRKLAKVGDTIREPSRTLTIYEKAFELTASGDQFSIQIYTR